jgi:CRISPR-associated endonuclease/helicase Cas3
MEAMPLPIYAARAWLAQRRSAPDISDLEGQPGRFESDQTIEHALYLRWRGPDESELITPDQLRPGDTIIVPASWGGADPFGWKPTSTDPVRDVGDVCSFLARRVPVLRLHDDLLANWKPEADAGKPSLSAVVRQFLSAGEDDGAVDTKGLLKTMADWTDLPQVLRDLAAQLREQGDRIKEVEYSTDTSPGIALIGRRLSERLELPRHQEPDHGDFTNEDDTASLTGERRVRLTDHCGDVKWLAKSLAERIGLSREMTANLALAGWLHDVGKADPRFQAWLLDGDRVAAETATELFAKSRMSPRNRAAILRARERATYPKGARHECLSVALLAGNPAAMNQVNDQELVLHLIGTHHGRGRPFVPIVVDDNPEQVVLLLTDEALLPHTDGERNGILLTASSQHGLERLDSGWTDRFWRVVRRYGWWGIALLEAILQLADHRCSEQVEQRGRNR